jgi:hypothetical protein
MTQSRQVAVVGSIANAVPYLLIFFAALLAIFFAIRFGAAVNALRVIAFLRHREAKSLERFLLEAREAGVSKKVATEAYAILTPYYRKVMRVQLDDHLIGDLRLSQYAVLDAAGNLLARSNRMRRPGESSPKSPTVVEWMLYVEHSPPAFAELAEPVVAPSHASDPLKSFIRPLRLPPNSQNKPEVAGLQSSAE